MSSRIRLDPATGNPTALSSVVAGSLAAAGAVVTPLFEAQRGDFSFTVGGTFVGSLRIERNIDGSSAWTPVSVSPGGAVAAWTAPGLAVFPEPEDRARYRVNCTAYTSGTATWRFGQ